MEDRSGWLKDLIRDVPDFPQPGVVFKDITPLLADAEALSKAVGELAGAFNGEDVDKVLGIEARGFLIAAPVALALGAGFVPVRKAGKLPWHVHAESYQLEYGTDTLEMHADAIGPGDRVLIVDDVLATGGTAAAVARMVDHMGADAVGFAFVLELAFLGGRGKLSDRDTFSLVTFE
jgi:adenine phosphoribosyltransferase